MSVPLPELVRKMWQLVPQICSWGLRAQEVESAALKFLVARRGKCPGQTTASKVTSFCPHLAQNFPAMLRAFYPVVTPSLVWAPVRHGSPKQAQTHAPSSWVAPYSLRSTFQLESHETG